MACLFLVKEQSQVEYPWVVNFQEPFLVRQVKSTQKEAQEVVQGSKFVEAMCLLCQVVLQEITLVSLFPHLA